MHNVVWGCAEILPKFAHKNHQIQIFVNCVRGSGHPSGLSPTQTVKKCDGYHFYGACNFLTLWHCTCNMNNYSNQSYEGYIAVNKGSALFSKISEVAQFSSSNSYAWIRKNNPTVTFVTMYIHACK